MGKGYEKNQERLQVLNSFGKILVRRSKSCCELCGSSDSSLSIFEYNPEKEASIDRCFFICKTCKEELSQKKMDSDYWRFTSSSMWSEVPVVQAQVYSLLQVLSKDNQWATDLLDQFFLSEDVSRFL